MVFFRKKLLRGNEFRSRGVPKFQRNLSNNMRQKHWRLCGLKQGILAIQVITLSGPSLKRGEEACDPFASLELDPLFDRDDVSKVLAIPPL